MRKNRYSWEQVVSKQKLPHHALTFAKFEVLISFSSPRIEMALDSFARSNFISLAPISASFALKFGSPSAFLYLLVILITELTCLLHSSIDLKYFLLDANGKKVAI